MIRLGINGFGRIGRLAFRAAIKRNNIKIVAINDLSNIEDLAYLLKYDSVHGRFDGEIKIENKHLIVNGNKIRITNEKDPKNIAWNEVKAEYIVESTGFFTTKEKAELHLEAGAKKVIISAPSKDVKMYVMGVNDKELSTQEKIVSNASCTTNCLAPITKIINDNFGFEEGLMTTVHAATSTQNLVDGNNKKRTRGRSALNNIIPTTTGAANAVINVIPELKGKLTGLAIRVPVPDVSLIDLTFKTKKKTSITEILECLKKESETNYKGIVDYTEDEVVSQDFVSETHTSVIDASASIELNDTFFKIIAWYDNEFGYANKIIDLVELTNKN